MVESPVARPAIGDELRGLAARLTVLPEQLAQQSEEVEQRRRELAEIQEMAQVGSGRPTSIPRSAAGPTRPSASTGSETDQDVLVRIEVADTGIGIASADIPKLFESFRQADASTTRRYGGTRLGLAICRELAALMGGEIGAESEVGKGSTFWFTVVLVKRPQESLPLLPPQADLNGIRVLVVDDNATNRMVLAHEVAIWGMQPEEAAGGAEGLEILRAAVKRAQPFALAIIDKQMPGMDGIELARAISLDPSLPATRLVMLTSSGQRGDGQAASKAGIAGYLTKPVRQSDLRRVIATVLGLGGVSPPRQLVTHYTMQKAERRARRRLLVVEDNAINQRVAVRLLEKLGYSADVTGNGLEAVEALARISYAAVLMDCHMPEMDGYQASSEIRRREGEDRHTPIIAMTAGAMEDDRALCLAAAWTITSPSPCASRTSPPLSNAGSPPNPSPRRRIPSRSTKLTMTSVSLRRG